MVVELDARHALVKLDGKAIQGCLPIAYWHRPFLADVFQDQVEQLEVEVRWVKSGWCGGLTGNFLPPLNSLNFKWVAQREGLSR